MNCYILAPDLQWSTIQHIFSTACVAGITGETVDGFCRVMTATPVAESEFCISVARDQEFITPEGYKVDVL